MKRLGVYFFYDEDGVVDRYVPYILENIVRYCQRFIVVVNGRLNQPGAKLFSRFTPEVIQRKNEGFDVWAYKAAIDYVGWQELSVYDELLLMNHTIMGPVHDLMPMFEAMEQRTHLDFWGVTKCLRVDTPETQRMWNVPYGYSPEHIQSSFTVFRKRLVSSKVFQDYWNNLAPIKTYYESGGKHEQFITKYFADNGFKWDCYTNLDKFYEEHHGVAPLITMPLDIVKDLKSPFFKRRSFFLPKKELPYALPIIREFMDYLETHTTYDTTMIYENLIRTCNQRDLLNSLLFVHIVE